MVTSVYFRAEGDKSMAEGMGYNYGAPSVSAPPSISQVASTPSTEQLPDPAAQKPDLSKMGPYVMNAWTSAKLHRRQSGVEDKLMNNLRDVSGEYSFEEQAKIKELGQPLIFVQNPDSKRRACNAIIRQIFFESYKPFYVLTPSPVQEIDPADADKIASDVIQEYIAVRTSEFVDQGYNIQEASEMALRIPPDPEALKLYVESRRDEMDNSRKEVAGIKVGRMSDKIADQRLEGGYDEALMKVADCCSTFGTGVLKGPFRRMRQRVSFVAGGCVQKPKEVLEWSCVNPLDCYPAKGSRDIQKGDFFERVRYTSRELRDMSKLGEGNGYFPEAIKRVLNRYPNGGCVFLEPTDAERNRLENDGFVGSSSQTSIIEGIEGYCDIKGSMLKSIGVVSKGDGSAIDDDEYYDANCVVVSDEVIFCTLTDENFGRPLYKGVFYENPNSWWGYSPVDKMRDLTRSYNASFRAKCVNVSCCSGPRQYINTNKLKPGQRLDLIPYGNVLFDDPSNNSQPPIRVFQAASNIDEIWRDLEATLKLIDHVTGIMSASHMDDTAASAGRTYNGMLLLIQAQKQGANDVVLSLFKDVCKKALTYIYRYNMLFDPDDGIKGDCEVDAGGLLAILTREQNRNSLESFLTMVIGSPELQQKIGDAGMFELLRTYIHTLEGINPDKIIPSAEEVERRERLAEMNARIAQMSMNTGVDQQQPQEQTRPQPTQQKPVQMVQPVPKAPFQRAQKNQPVEMNA